jgi:predicted  nucleic acid-binding Zn-ribbon protein
MKLQKFRNYIEKKIQLSIVDDLQNYNDSLNGITRTLEGDLSTFKSLRSRVQSEAASGEQRVKQINQELQKLKQAAKDLGVNPATLPQVKESERLIRDFESLTRGRAKLGGLLSL